MIITVALALALTVVIAATIGWAITCSTLRQRIRELEQECAHLQADIDMRMSQWREAEALKRRFAARFHRFASQENARAGRPSLYTAGRRRAPCAAAVQPDRSRRAFAVDHLTRPLREQLAQTDQQLRRCEMQRRKAYAALARGLRRH